MTRNLFVFCSCFCLAVPLVAQDFTKITNDPSANDGGSSHAIGWGDFDNDGWLDLAVSHHNGLNNLLCRNNGNGSFTKITNSVVANDGGDSYSCIWGDYDNDGWLDLFVSNVSGTNWLYRNQGGVFTRLTNFFTEHADSTASAWGDYDNDGWLDLFVANYHGLPNFLYHNNGDGTFSRISNGIVVTDAPGASGCGWGDYDNDGLLDLFVSNPFSTNNLNLLYHNDGNGSFTKVTNGPVVTDVGFSYGCVWGDYDNDGWLDLFVANNGLKNFLYHNNGNGTFTKITSGDIVNDVANSYNGVWGDYDNDGWLDLFVANFGGNNLLYHNNGDGTFTRQTNGIIVNDGGASAGCAWADYDNDGALDLYVTNHGGNNYLYHNNHHTNSWITIKCIGTASNRSAIGARVSLRATIRGVSRWQYRQITGGDSISGGSLDAHFGLGDATAVELLRIQWPSGIAQEFTGLASNQILTVVEPPIQSTASLAPGGIFHVKTISRKGTVLQIDSATNLNEWVFLTTITNSTGVADFDGPPISGIPSRFYRISLH